MHNHNERRRTLRLDNHSRRSPDPRGSVVIEGRRQEKIDDLLSTLSEACPIGDALARGSVAPRMDGRHVLEPMICSVGRSRVSCVQRLRTSGLKTLHNEGSHSADKYPLRLQTGLFFSEAVGERNPAAEAYHDLINQSIQILARRLAVGGMSFDDLEECGEEIQSLDARFAAERIDRPLDSIHACLGPDPSHPYSKITICRTAFPVSIHQKEVWFFFEKFLVSYSYLDRAGHRRSTVTPIHSHPMNFETVYFVSHGRGSCAIEQEFFLLKQNGDRIVGTDGSIDREFLGGSNTLQAAALRIFPGPKTEIRPTGAPILLQAFSSERVLRASEDLIATTDGLFRPHQVHVVDDPEIETRYFAIDNYFGPVGRVLLYNDSGSVDVWSHDDWDN